MSDASHLPPAAPRLHVATTSNYDRAKQFLCCAHTPTRSRPLITHFHTHCTHKYTTPDLDATEWSLENLEMLDLSDNEIGGER